MKVAKEYATYLLHDFYDDRETVVGLLREKNHIADEDRHQTWVTTGTPCRDR